MLRCLLFAGCMPVVLVCIGCAATPKIDRYAAARGFEKAIVEGKGFRHVVYKNARAGVPGPALNIYIEGDGNPYLGRHVTQDPTSAHTMMLRLMAQDTAPAVYLGRPCYLGLYLDEGCDKKHWSSDRYSAAVADSMSAALMRIAAGRDVNLLGHSGGGTLAVLMAARMPQVKSVLTVAGNLDTDAWTRRHRYEPLSGSLNPRLQPPLPPSIAQIHLAGGKDKIVYPEFIESFARSQVNAVYRPYPRQKHDCCWESIWPEILKSINSDR